MNFLKDVSGWCNHRPLLWWALEATRGSSFPVLEMGCGEGSTPYLRDYCQKNERPFLSYDSDAGWAQRFGAAHVESWDGVVSGGYSVVLVDHAPGERRHVDIALLADRADYVVIHDSEPAATGYMLDRIWGLFASRRNLVTGGAWASIVSQKPIPEIRIDGFRVE